MNTTIGQLLINENLPEDLRDYSRVLDKKALKELFTQLAYRHPDKYSETAQRLMDVGRDVATQTNGFSFGLDALRKTVAAREAEIEIEQQLDELFKIPGLDEKTRNKKMVEILQGKLAKLPGAVMDEATALDNPLARQVRSGAKGNRMNLNALVGADLLYTDANNNPIPFPILRNYAQGFRPYEYFAGAYGARKGVLDTKLATSDAGYLLKQLTQMNHRLLVTADDDNESPYDPSSPRGLPTEVDDPDNVGALLAHPIAGYERNTVLTPKILKAIKAAGHARILLRSPTVGGPEDGGVYSRDVGMRERGQMAPIGDYVGIAAAQALGERLTQGALSSKHSGGAATATAKAVTGFERINALIQVPKNFPDEAAHSEVDGRVDRVEPAPQGGHYLYVGQKQHYILPGNEIKVKLGEEVEAGDVLSTGMPNPATIVKHKGIGEGRRYFTNLFRQVMQDSDIPANRRNVELLSRGMINYVRLTDPYQDWVPDDIVPYNAIERRYKPRPGYQAVAPTAAVGKYLERPVLHYTIGTKLQPKMVKELQEFGVSQVFAHADPPIFQPEMIRGATNVTNDPDWMTRMLGSYQEKSFLRGVHRGDVSNAAGSSYVPSLAKGVNFGNEGLTKPWKPGEPAQNPFLSVD